MHGATRRGRALRAVVGNTVVALTHHDVSSLFARQSCTTSRPFVAARQAAHGRMGIHAQVIGTCILLLCTAACFAQCLRATTRASMASDAPSNALGRVWCLSSTSVACDWAWSFCVMLASPNLSMLLSCVRATGGEVGAADVESCFTMWIPTCATVTQHVF